MAELPGHDRPTWASFSEDGELVVTVDRERAQVWDLRVPGRRVAATEEVRGGLARFTPSGDIIVSDDDGTLYLWKWRVDDPLRRLSGFRGAVQVTDLHLDPAGSRAVTAGTDRVARIWDLATGRELATLRGHDGLLYSAQFSPDGRAVVTLSADGTARIWDAATGAQVRSLVADRPLRTAAFDPAGVRVVAGAVDGSVRIWQAATGRTLSVLFRHTSAVNAATFSPDGERILSAGDDWTASVYRCTTCGELAPLRADAEDLVARILAAGEHIVTGWALAMGDCYDQEGARARIVDCGSLHDAEVFAVIENPAGPQVAFDRAQVSAYGEAQCKGEPFRSYVGRRYEGAGFRVATWLPSETSWEAGDRRTVCVLSKEGKSAGTARAPGSRSRQ